MTTWPIVLSLSHCLSLSLLSLHVTVKMSQFAEMFLGNKSRLRLVRGSVRLASQGYENCFSIAQRRILLFSPTHSHFYLCLLDYLSLEQPWLLFAFELILFALVEPDPKRGVSSVLHTMRTHRHIDTHLLHPWLICWVDAEGESVEIQIWFEADLFRWPPSIAIYGKLWPNHFHIFTSTRTMEKNKTISHTSFISGHKINWFTTTAQFYLLSKSINIKFWIVIQNFFGLGLGFGFL